MPSPEKGAGTPLNQEVSKCSIFQFLRHELRFRSMNLIIDRGKDRMKVKVEGRSILCYCATDSLWINKKDLVKRLRLKQPVVGQAIRRG